ncbi:MAG: CDP-glycerol glycerophosphotransferase family protein [Verrucomicrobiae bacterium]|nr:CDP-glycerol glycerophosphotransferase family protein [Verrucomicrobiae bacterium]
MPKAAKVFLILKHGTALRNFLKTDFLPTLLSRPELEVHVFTPLWNDPSLVEEVANSRVRLRPMPEYREGSWEKKVIRLHRNSWASRSRLRSYWSERFHKRPNAWLLHASEFLLGLAVAPIPEKLWRRWINNASHDEASRALLLKERPDLIFYVNHNQRENSLVKEAQKLGIRTLYFCENWDHLYQWPSNLVHDELLVWGPIVRDLVVKHHQVRWSKITCVGVPQFDVYVNGRLPDRDTFFREHKLDPSVPLVFFATTADEDFPYNHEMIDIVLRMNEAGQFHRRCQFILRPHPRCDFAKYEKYGQRPGVYVQRAGRPAGVADGWNPSVGDMVELASTIRHSDVVICPSSTIIVDAIACDKPVVAIAFDGNHEDLDFYLSHRRIFKFELMQDILRFESFQVAEKQAEFRHFFNQALDEPKVGSVGRQAVRSELCYQVDGQSARRIAEEVLRRLPTAGETQFRQVRMPTAEKIGV